MLPKILHRFELPHPACSADRYPCDTCRFTEMCAKPCWQGAHCEQRVCKVKNCSLCGGSIVSQRGTGIDNVPLVCCKSPVRDLFTESVIKDTYAFQKRQKLKGATKGILISQGSAPYAAYTPGTDLVAVGFRHVWSRRGWYSCDLKDYLKLPAGARLILLTSQEDHYLEKGWEAQLYDADFAKVGFDYWQPLEFSAYTGDCKYTNFWANYRTLYALERSQAHFSLGSVAASLTSPGLRESPFVKAAEAAPNMVLACQAANTKGTEFLRGLLGFVKRWQAIVPRRLTFLFLGVNSETTVFLIARNLPDHDCYFASSGPEVAARNGDLFTATGGRARSKLPKKDLVLLGQQNYANLVQRALRAARRGNDENESKQQEV